MNLFLSTDNHKTIIKLPIMPSEFRISSTYNNEVFTTINQGDIKLLGQRGLKSLSWDSFFPARRYAFNRANDYSGWEYVELFESWRDQDEPIRMLMTNSPINMLMTIDEFEYGLQDGTSDVYYSMTLSEFKRIRLKKKKVK